MDLNNTFSNFNNLKALVIGDVMVDSYVWGKVNRISPEAPVPIVHVTRRDTRLGGAANVALNVKALGAEPLLCAVVGDDAEGDGFCGILEKKGISQEGIIRQKDRITTVKHRIISASQHILRIDTETDKGISSETAEKIIAFVQKKIEEVGVIIFEDYDKGLLNEETIARIIKIAKVNGVPTVVDPKKKNFLSYAGCSLFKPNLKELKEGIKHEFESGDIEALGDAVKKLKTKMDIGAALITLSEYGVFITNFDETHHIPAHKREIADVSGAGDTVVSIAALCLAAGLPLDKVAGIANLGGGLVCEHLGVVPIEKERLLQEALKLK
ncbi:PfkB family carbohydrate kinase [Flammeovirgaceae bacterium SG7u.111]|nr:PfkB family carbohydrate kinase [Flammeovirgaceae bacterium SG7u.132]WPO36910.1 PfkB family carbohydrate kinase [Flammeovirgaceae bacterium SG7u.111]